MTLPDDLLDEHGYPTEEWLEYIRGFRPETPADIEEFVADLRTGWWMPDWGIVLRRRRSGQRALELHTGGWSGNEEIVEAITGNFMICHMLGYYMWRRGGHYYFRFRTSGT